MTKRMRRLVSVTVASLPVLALAPGSALAAAPTPITGTAKAVTPLSATLTGAIAPAGNSVTYVFQYGTTAQYGQTTQPVTLPAQSAPEMVSAAVAGLHPKTAYHFRLAVITGATGGKPGYYYPYSVAYAGADSTFTTPAAPRKSYGRVILGATKFTVKNGAISVPLTCASTIVCKGTLTLGKRVRVGRKFNTLSFGTAGFTLRAGKKGSVTIKLSAVGKAVLLLSKHHTTSVTLADKNVTGQRGFKRTVKLR